jgi:hypothetical protein
MHTMSQGAVSVVDRGANRTRLTVGTTLVLLVAEFLLGMYVNLFVPTPHGQPALVAHIALGSLLLVMALVTAGTAVASRRPVTALLAAAGLLFLVVAWTGGARFLGGGGRNADSYLMAAGFVLAGTCYVLALELGRRGGA